MSSMELLPEEAPFYILEFRLFLSFERTCRFIERGPIKRYSLPNAYPSANGTLNPRSEKSPGKTCDVPFFHLEKSRTPSFEYVSATISEQHRADASTLFSLMGGGIA